MLYSFTRRVKRSGILRETRARRFRKRPVSRVKRKLSAINRTEKRVLIEQQKKLGLA